MVYEYCDEIKNCGIRRNAFPASVETCFEAGIYITSTAEKEFNAIFQEAAMIELHRYKNNIISEADNSGLGTKIIEKIKKAFGKFFAGVKAVFERLIKWLDQKMNEFSKKVGDKFKSIEFSKYSTALDKVAKTISGGKKDITIIGVEGENINSIATKLSGEGTSMINGMLKTFYNAKGELRGDSYVAGYKNTKGAGLRGVGDYANAIVKSLYSSAADTSSLSGAKDNFEEYLGKETTNKIDGSWIVKNSDKIYNMVANRGAIKAVNGIYKAAKELADTAEKKFDEVKGFDDTQIREASRLILSCATATESLLLDLADLTKNSFSSCMRIASLSVVYCTVGKKDKAEVKTEGYTAEFVESCFNW